MKSIGYETGLSIGGGTKFFNRDAQQKFRCQRVVCGSSHEKSAFKNSKIPLTIKKGPLSLTNATALEPGVASEPFESVKQVHF